MSMSKEEFIARARHYLHNYDYDYSNIDYQGRDVPVEVRCPKHSVFSVNPMRHLNGSICPGCYKDKYTK